MAITEPHRESPAYVMAERFRERSLRRDDSLFTPGKAIWTLDHLLDLNTRFQGQPDESDLTFQNKLDKQLAGAPDPVIQLMAEVYFVHLLVASDVLGETKRKAIVQVLGKAREPIGLPEDVAEALDAGILKTGIAFKTYRPYQLWLVIDFAIAWKKATSAQREAWLRDPWAFRDMLFSVPHRAAFTQRNALLHLVHPLTFEDCVSRDHKQKIAEAFAGLAKTPEADVDRRLFEIRQALAPEHGESFDFYASPLVERWRKQATPRARRYWAGGIQWGKTSMLPTFVAGNYWQLGYGADDHTGDFAMKMRGLFEEIAPGDWFAIKGFGGQSQLHVHYVGEVKRVDPDAYRIDLQPLDAQLYRGQGPSGPGAGNWWESLLEVKRPDVVASLFKLRGHEQGRAAGSTSPKNLILFGPPGTGKTFRLRNHHAKAFEGGDAPPPTLDEQAVLGLTWFQCAALALEQLKGRASVDALEQHPILQAKYRAQSPATPLRPLLWAALQTHTIRSSKTVNYRRRTPPLVFDKGDDGDWRLVAPLPEELADLRPRVVPEAGDRPSSRSVFVSFHPAFSYDDFIEGIRPEVALDESTQRETLVYRRRDGVFTKACNEAVRLAGYPDDLHAFCSESPERRRELLQNAPPYAVFIDEINRGNVPQVLGELITLLEPDKRLGAENEIVATLPLSGRRFGVPSNVYVIGTMNTADRSLQALDTALRRRFAFEEVPPDYDRLDVEIEETVHLGDMLRAINGRIERLYDRDHVIGHAYFEPVVQRPDLATLKEVFRRHVLPLLQEYFFDDWSRIGLVLGESLVEAVPADAVPFARFPQRGDDWDRPTLYRLRNLDALTAEEFRSIYDLGE